MTDDTVTILKDEPNFSIEQLFGACKIASCVACGAMFVWPSHPKIRPARFCPSCGRRNTAAK